MRQSGAGDGSHRRHWRGHRDRLRSAGGRRSWWGAWINDAAKRWRAEYVTKVARPCFSAGTCLDAAQVQAMVEATVAAYGRLDIGFNNAGVSGDGPHLLHEYGIAEWRRTIERERKGRVAVHEVRTRADAFSGSARIDAGRDSQHVIDRGVGGQRFGRLYGKQACGHRPDKERGPDLRRSGHSNQLRLPCEHTYAHVRPIRTADPGSGGGLEGITPGRPDRPSRGSGRCGAVVEFGRIPIRDRLIPGYRRRMDRPIATPGRHLLERGKPPLLLQRGPRGGASAMPTGPLEKGGKGWALAAPKVTYAVDLINSNHNISGVLTCSRRIRRVTAISDSK